MSVIRPKELTGGRSYKNEMEDPYNSFNVDKSGLIFHHYPFFNIVFP